jgi:Fe2+ or Zn2+ uptake regulation protein
MRSPAELTRAFRSLGLKVTPQRQLLFRLLHDNTSHPTAETVFAVASAQMPGISLRTVYQTLTDLTVMGELQSLSFGVGAVRFDPNVGAHHHRVCVSCAEIADVYLDGAEQLHAQDPPCEGLQGFAVESTDIVFRGRCNLCKLESGLSHSAPDDALTTALEISTPITSTRMTVTRSTK